MKTAEAKISSAAGHLQQKANKPFFAKDSESDFFSGSYNSYKSSSNFFNTGAVQTKLTVGQPGDIYEKEADAMADKVVQRLGENQPGVANKNDKAIQTKPVAPVTTITPSVQAKCAACEHEEKLQKKEEEDKSDLINVELQKKPIFESNEKPPDDDENVQRKCAECEKEDKVQTKPNSPDSPSALSHIESSLNSSKGSGSPVPAATRKQMENSFGADFSGVRIHTDNSAVQMNKGLNAQAFTYGNDIYFNSGKFSPETTGGKRLLAHELTHVVHQVGNPGLKRKIQRSSLADFRTNLEATSADHQTVISELFSHAGFVPLVNYLNGCPPNTIDFQVQRAQQRVEGRLVDLFGGFEPGSPSTMTVNPFRREHATNPLEMVDTIVHEFMHAILALQTVCTTRANTFPLSGGITDAHRDPELQPYIEAAVLAGDDPFLRNTVERFSRAGTTTASGANLLEYFQNNYGPSASRPRTHYVDLNRAGLQMVTSIISDIHRAHPNIGAETVSFDNVELMDAARLIGARSWWNATQRRFSMGLHKNRVARKRSIEPGTFAEKDYDASAIQVVEFADSKNFDPNTDSHWGHVGGVWQCDKRSRFSGKPLHTYVTGTRAAPPGGIVNYRIIQHT